MHLEAICALTDLITGGNFADSGKLLSVAAKKGWFNSELFCGWICNQAVWAHPPQQTKKRINNIHGLLVRRGWRRCGPKTPGTDSYPFPKLCTFPQLQAIIQYPISAGLHHVGLANEKKFKLVFHKENTVFLLNYNCSFLLLCAGILERDFYTFPKVLDKSTSKKKIPFREWSNFSNESIPRKKHQCLSAYWTWVPHDVLGGRNSYWNECAQRGEQGTDLSACPGCQSESALMFCLWYTSLIKS